TQIPSLRTSRRCLGRRSSGSRLRWRRRRPRSETPMQVYRRKTLLNDNADVAAFTKLYGDSVYDNSSGPFLLIREDDTRLLIVTDDGAVMLCLANGPNDCSVSYASSYSARSREFAGLSGPCTAKDENFVDPTFAIKAAPYVAAA